LEFGKLQLELLYKLDQQLIDREEAQYEVERFWVGALRDAVVDGQVERGSLMAGQSVGLVDKIQPLHAIMREMIDDAEKELQRLSRLLSEKEAPNDPPT
jgi:enoyl-[acyl-carrier protein] reductase II